MGQRRLRSWAPDFINDPAHWRQRAEEMRTLADDMRDLESKERMLRIADDYDRLARRAEERFRGNWAPIRADATSPSDPCAGAAIDATDSSRKDDNRVLIGNPPIDRALAEN